MFCVSEPGNRKSGSVALTVLHHVHHEGQRLLRGGRPLVHTVRPGDRGRRWRLARPGQAGAHRVDHEAGDLLARDRRLPHPVLLPATPVAKIPEAGYIYRTVYVYRTVHILYSIYYILYSMYPRITHA